MENKGKRIIERWRVPWIIELSNPKTYIEVNDYGLKLCYEEYRGTREFHIPRDMVDEMIVAMLTGKHKIALGKHKQERYN